MVSEKAMVGSMKMEPPFVPAMYGNFQMAPRPTAEPADARMNPILEDQAERLTS